MVDGSNNNGVNNEDADVVEAVPCESDIVYLKAEFLFADTQKEYDQMDFYYSYDGRTWNRIGTSAYTQYDISPMFMGIRVGIFNYATSLEGGYVDVDYFHVQNELTGEAEYMGDADPPSVTLPVQTENHSDVAPLAERIILSKVKKLTVRRKKSGKVVLKWKKVRGAEKYEVIYSAGKKMKKGVKKLVV